MPAFRFKIFTNTKTKQKNKEQRFKKQKGLGKRLAKDHISLTPGLTIWDRREVKQPSGMNCSWDHCALKLKILIEK